MRHGQPRLDVPLLPYETVHAPLVIGALYRRMPCVYRAHVSTSHRTQRMCTRVEFRVWTFATWEGVCGGYCS